MSSSELESSFGKLLAYKKAKQMFGSLNVGERFDLTMLTALVESINGDVDFTDPFWGALQSRDFEMVRNLSDVTIRFLECEIADLDGIDPGMMETRKFQLATIRRIVQDNTDKFRDG